MFRRLAATLLVVLVLAVVSATPAVAKSSKDKGGDSGPVVSAPGPQDPGGSSGGSSTGSGDSGTGTGDTEGSTTSGSAGGSTTSTGSDKSQDPSTNTDTPKRKKSADPSPRPSSVTSATSTAGAGTTPSSSIDRSAVRASAAPVATDTGITALLPAPNPMLLPDSSTNATAPVDAERPSGLPQALLAVLVGAGVLSVALVGTVLARRRGLHSHS